MEPLYWLNRWNKHETGWHQTEVESRLIEHFKDLSPTRVFVPLCGKSLDLKWLADQGHEVVGIELSPIAIQEFFSENGLTPRIEQHRSFQRFVCGRIQIYQGDFFDLQPDDLGQIGAIYDRAALIALPPSMRGPYADHMIQLLEGQFKNPEFRFLQILLKRTPHDLNGPPHSITTDELEELYSQQFEIKLISREQLEPLPSGVQIEEAVYALNWRK